MKVKVWGWGLVFGARVNFFTGWGLWFAFGVRASDWLQGYGSGGWKKCKIIAGYLAK